MKQFLLTAFVGLATLATQALGNVTGYWTTIDDETNVVSVETSPLQSVIFYTDSFYAPGRVVEAEEGGAVTQASYTPTRWDHVVRVEGIDHEGKRVWSNYIKLNRE